MPQAYARFPELDTRARATDYRALLSTLPPFLLPVVPPTVPPVVSQKSQQESLQYPPPGFASEAAQLRADGGVVREPGGIIKDGVPRVVAGTLGTPGPGLMEPEGPVPPRTPPPQEAAAVRDRSEGDGKAMAARVAARLRLAHWPSQRERPLRDLGGHIRIPKARDSSMPQGVPSRCGFPPSFKPQNIP